MKLHGNAALSLNKPRLLCRRVVDQGWVLSEAARATEVSARTASASPDPNRRPPGCDVA
jgi:hypothetical protein